LSGQIHERYIVCTHNNCLNGLRQEEIFRTHCNFFASHKQVHKCQFLREVLRNATVVHISRSSKRCLWTDLICDNTVLRSCFVCRRNGWSLPSISKFVIARNTVLALNHDNNIL
jgi:hypothetical protein